MHSLSGKVQDMVQMGVTDKMPDLLRLAESNELLLTSTSMTMNYCTCGCSDSDITITPSTKNNNHIRSLDAVDIFCEK